MSSNHGRNPGKLSTVISELKEQTKNENIKGFIADFSDLDAVEQMAHQIKREVSQIDVLINNAGVYNSSKSQNNDGLDMRFVVNYLAPFLLTNELIPLLKKGEEPRIINLSSAAQSPINYRVLTGVEKRSERETYAQSKLALTMWSFYLAKKEPDINVIAVNPGSLLNTNMVKEAFGNYWSSADKGADAGKSILIINGAGGVGSIAIQLAKKLAKLNVIATASRPETIAWCQKLGADLVVNHRNDLAEEIDKVGYQNVDYILCLNDTDGHWQAMTKAIKPQGIICSIVENEQPLDMDILKSKSAGMVWEFMFTRSMYQTEDMTEQSNLLNELSKLIEDDVIISTCNDVVKPINAKNLRDVHQRLEKGRTIGKIVLANWS